MLEDLLDRRFSRVDAAVRAARDELAAGLGGLRADVRECLDELHSANGRIRRIEDALDARYAGSTELRSPIGRGKEAAKPAPEEPISRTEEADGRSGLGKKAGALSGHPEESGADLLAWSVADAHRGPSFTECMASMDLRLTGMEKVLDRIADQVGAEATPDAGNDEEDRKRLKEKLKARGISSAAPSFPLYILLLCLFVCDHRRIEYDLVVISTYTICLPQEALDMAQRNSTRKIESEKEVHLYLSLFHEFVTNVCPVLLS